MIILYQNFDRLLQEAKFEDAARKCKNTRKDITELK